MTIVAHTYILTYLSFVVGTRRENKTKTTQEDFAVAGGSNEDAEVAGLRRSDHRRWCDGSGMRSGRLYARYIAARTFDEP